MTLHQQFDAMIWCFDQEQTLQQLALCCISTMQVLAWIIFMVCGVWSITVFFMFFRKSSLRKKLSAPVSARLIAALGSVRRFLLIPVLSAGVGFCLASLLLNPQWFEPRISWTRSLQTIGFESFLPDQAEKLWSSFKAQALPGADSANHGSSLIALIPVPKVSEMLDQVVPDFGFQWPEWLSVHNWLSRLPRPGQQGFAPRAKVSEQGQVETRFADCPQFFPSDHRPVVPGVSGLRELCFSAFAVLHSGQTRTPVFVVQRLNRASLLQAREVTRTDRFYADARLPLAERAELDDYVGSGYSRGHMAPAADMPTPEAMAQSFSLANIVPQNQRHNASAWSHIEEDTRKYVMRARGDVFVFTGPYHGDRNEPAAAGRVAVPSHLFKVVYDATEQRAWVHWHWNSDETLASPPISYAEFVRRTGFQLLPTD